MTEVYEEKKIYNKEKRVLREEEEHILSTVKYDSNTGIPHVNIVPSLSIISFHGHQRLKTLLSQRQTGHQHISEIALKTLRECID